MEVEQFPILKVDCGTNKDMWAKILEFLLTGVIRWGIPQQWANDDEEERKKGQLVIMKMIMNIMMRRRTMEEANTASLEIMVREWKVGLVPGSMVVLFETWVLLVGLLEGAMVVCMVLEEGFQKEPFLEMMVLWEEMVLLVFQSLPKNLLQGFSVMLCKEMMLSRKLKQFRLVKICSSLKWLVHVLESLVLRRTTLVFLWILVNMRLRLLRILI
mmetsp:Transcript_15113/g.21167  ORF Transcript_15113/g.21167 Transcript_15113/m.21167 type:complete len:214 (+) Transcript_15113:1640-2281(+)